MPGPGGPLALTSGTHASTLRVMAGRSGSGITRRGFLRRAGFLAALGAVAELRPALVTAELESGADGGGFAAGGGFLSAADREVLAPLVERLVHGGHPDAPAVGGTAAVATIDRLLARTDPAITWAVPLALGLFQWGPVLFDLRLSRFTRLDAAAQDASIRGWMTSRFAFRRFTYRALRNLAFVGYYTQEATWAPIGYKGPLVARGSGP